jgi:hypothetical protein
VFTVESSVVVVVGLVRKIGEGEEVVKSVSNVDVVIGKEYTVVVWNVFVTVELAGRIMVAVSELMPVKKGSFGVKGRMVARGVTVSIEEVGKEGVPVVVMEVLGVEVRVLPLAVPVM